jgi:hypothetical protein
MTKRRVCCFIPYSSKQAREEQTSLRAHERQAPAGRFI